MHYHLYNALAWHQGRLPSEFFAASTQTYLNPLPHLPYYNSIKVLGKPVLATSLVAILHSCNLWLLHMISLIIQDKDGREPKRLMVIGSVLIGAFSPAFLVEVGGSFSDIIVSIPVLIAFLFAVYFLRMEERSKGNTKSLAGMVVMSGALAGVAAGLKPTTAVDLIGLFVGLVFVAKANRSVIALLYISGSVAGYILSGGRHALMLWGAFNNPVFPMFNAVFRSPWIEPINLVSDRFRPATFVGALIYPFDLADAFSRAGFELLAVDYRPILLIFFFGLLLAKHVIGMAMLRFRPINIRSSEKFFWIANGCAGSLWLFTSGNVRYAMPLFLMFGIGFMQAATRFPKNFLKYVLLIPLSLQALAALTLNSKRWDYQPSWDDVNFEWDLPDKLKEIPAYYLSLQSQSYSAIALALPLESRLTNVLGHMPLNPEGLMWHKCIEQKKYLNLPWRSLIRVSSVVGESGVPRSLLDFQDAMLSEYNLMANRADCDFIMLGKSNGLNLHWVDVNDKSQSFTTPSRVILLSCLLEDGQVLTEEDISYRKSLDARFADWENRCPNLFSPSPAVSVQTGITKRMRIYNKSETKLLVINDRLYAQSMWTSFPVLLQDENLRDLVSECPDLPSYNASRKGFR